MTMVVECESCRSRFRLNESLLKESKAVRFRCRKCGGFILVRNPHAPPVIPVSPVPPEMAATPVAPDIPPAVRQEIEGLIPNKTPVPPPPTYDFENAVPAPPVLPIPTLTRLEDLVIFSPGKDPGLPRASTRRKRPLGRKVLVAGLSILLPAGGVLYFGTTLTGQELLGKRFRLWGAAPQASVAAKPAYDVREMKSTVHEQAVAGNLFVVSGTVVNVGKGVSRGIRMRATLLGEDNQVLIENSSIAGNLIDEPTLLHMNRNPIEADLKTEYRVGGEHREILPGTSLPFMVVCFDPPGKIGSFTVRAVDVN